ncbi:hypothetical protein HMPREF3037_02114, partial [Candidatus Stoquefichus sp. KLE1796]
FLRHFQICLTEYQSHGLRFGVVKEHQIVSGEYSDIYYHHLALATICSVPLILEYL